MSTRYNKFAKQLETAFLKSREEYRAAADAVEKAEQERRSAEYFKEKFIGEKAAKIAVADARLQKAQAEFNHIADTVWYNFNRERDRLTAELHEAIRRDNIVNPESVDAATVELLKSGVCSASDFEALVRRFDGNPTMSRLIAKYALDGVQSAHSTEESAKLRFIAETVKQGVSATEAAWDDILYAANVCTGQAHGKGDLRYTVRMNDQWEQLVAPSVESF